MKKLVLGPEQMMQIRDEFAQRRDYGNLIFKYEEFDDDEVQKLVAKAYIQQMGEVKKPAEEAQLYDSFMAKYGQSEDAELRKNVIEMMFARIKKYELDPGNQQLNDWCSDLITAAQAVERPDIFVVEALLYGYWFKGLAQLRKDFFKAQYFLNKINSVCQDKTGELFENYLFKAHILKLRIGLRMKKSDAAHMNNDLYAVFDEMLERKKQHELDVVIINLMAELLNTCLERSHGHNPLQSEALLELLEYIQNNEFIQQKLLEAQNQLFDHYFLFKLAYLYRLQKEFRLSDTLLFANFNDGKFNQDINGQLKALWYANDEEAKTWRQHVISNYDRLTNMSKYREMFGVQER